MSQETIDAATTALSNGLILGLEQALNLAFNGVPFASTFNAFANSFVPPLASQITVADFELIAMYANTTFMVGFGIGASCLALILCTFFIFGKRREPSVFLRAIAASANLIALSMGVSNMTGAANMSMQVQGYGIGFFIIITLTTLTMALAWEVVESWESKRKMAYKALSLLLCLIYGGGGYYAISDAVSSCPAGALACPSKHVWVTLTYVFLFLAMHIPASLRTIHSQVQIIGSTPQKAKSAFKEFLGLALFFLLCDVTFLIMFAVWQPYVGNDMFHFLSANMWLSLVIFNDVIAYAYVIWKLSEEEATGSKGSKNNRSNKVPSAHQVSKIKQIEAPVVNDSIKSAVVLDSV